MAAKLSEKARAFLLERRFAVLGTINQHGSPQLTTMWFLLDGDFIMMNTKAGRTKERNMRRRGGKAANGGEILEGTAGDSALRARTHY